MRALRRPRRTGCASAELRGYRVGCLHGRLKAADRRSIMARFKSGELDVLVATTVIEVGVDVPNATIMIVQEADRFGLAQLHQLRGRVGRGAEQSYCLLVSRSREELTEVAIERLEALVASNDGFELAERDLEIRGEGQLLGARQSGLSDLRFVRLRRDRALLERATGRGPRRSTTRSCWPRRRIACSARRSIWASREDRRRLSEGPSDRGAEGRRHPTDGRSRPRSRLRARRPGRGSQRCSTSSRDRVRWASRRSRAERPGASSWSGTVAPAG